MGKRASCQPRIEHPVFDSRCWTSKNADHGSCIYCADLYFESRYGEPWIKWDTSKTWTRQECVGSYSPSAVIYHVKSRRFNPTFGFVAKN